MFKRFTDLPTGTKISDFSLQFTETKESVCDSCMDCFYSRLRSPCHPSWIYHPLVSIRKLQTRCRWKYNTIPYTTSC